MSLAGQGLDAFFLSFRGPDSGSNNFLFGGRWNRDPDTGLSSGALRAPELKTASRTPARSARRLRRKMFLSFVAILFSSFGS